MGKSIDAVGGIVHCAVMSMLMQVCTILLCILCLGWWKGRPNGRLLHARIAAASVTILCRDPSEPGSRW